MLLDLPVHPHAGVVDRDLEVPSGEDLVRLSSAVFLVEVRHAGGERQLAAFGHGVACVDRDVEKRVFELRGVADDHG